MSSTWCRLYLYFSSVEAWGCLSPGPVSLESAVMACLAMPYYSLKSPYFCQRLWKMTLLSGSRAVFDLNSKYVTVNTESLCWVRKRRLHEVWWPRGSMGRKWQSQDLNSDGLTPKLVILTWSCAFQHSCLWIRKQEGSLIDLRKSLWKNMASVGLTHVAYTCIEQPSWG